jgi:predicted pyridoxine 5'-phosphate oxidase superfamily flavin-nucleotide-binding protein
LPSRFRKDDCRNAPIFEDGDIILRDSQATLIYVARKWGGEAWLPTEAASLARVAQWLVVAENEIARRPNDARLHDKSGDKLDVALARERASHVLKVMDAHLARNDWQALGRPTIADIACMPSVALSQEGGIPLDPYPAARARSRQKDPGLHHNARHLRGEGVLSHTASDIAFSASVKAEQTRRGSRLQFERIEAIKGWPSTITPDLAALIASVRSFYLATASADGQPYVQHRGTHQDFCTPSMRRRWLSPIMLAIGSIGNLAENAKAFIFIMDYVRQRRVKLWGTAKVVEGDEALLSKLVDPRYRAAPERAILFTVEAWDRNSTQHIPRMLPFDDVAAAIGQLEQRVADLENENARLLASGAAP